MQHGLILILLVVASMLFIAGGAYFFRLPEGLAGSARAGTMDRQAGLSNRTIATVMVLALAVISAGWILLAAGHRLFGR
jgi:hypothetical protein